MPARQPKKDEINFIAIKKEKAVTLSPPLPYVYDGCLLVYGRFRNPIHITGKNIISEIAKTPEPPYDAVLFTSHRTKGDNGYGEMTGKWHKKVTT